jgi:hypothetical protein
MPAKKKYRTKKRAPYKRRTKRRRTTTKRSLASTKSASAMNHAKCCAALKYSLYPIENSPIKRPDSNGYHTIALTLVTTSTFVPQQLSNSTVAGQYCLFFTPGSIRQMWHKPAGMTFDVTDAGNPKITAFTHAEPADKYTELLDDGMGYRINGARLKISYIGNDEHNQGEFIIHKFKLPKGNPRDISHFPQEMNDSNSRTKFLAAKDGAEVVFLPNDSHICKNMVEIDEQNHQTGFDACVVWLNGGSETTTEKPTWRWTVYQTVEVQIEPDQLLHKVTRPTDAIGEQQFDQALNGVANDLAESNSDMNYDGGVLDQILNRIDEAIANSPAQGVNDLASNPTLGNVPDDTLSITDGDRRRRR